MEILPTIADNIVLTGPRAAADVQTMNNDDKMS